MKIATWNVNSLSVRLPQVLDWLAAQAASDSGAIDVLALQELKMSDDKFPHAAFAEAGYHAQWFGQKTYNGVALISRSEGTEVVKNIPGFADDMSRVIAATYPDGQGGTVRVIGAYFPNGQAPDSDKFAYKMRWLTALRAWVQTARWSCHCWSGANASKLATASELLKSHTARLFTAVWIPACTFGVSSEQRLW